jgi:uncharacterized membrane protein
LREQQTDLFSSLGRRRARIQLGADALFLPGCVRVMIPVMLRRLAGPLFVLAGLMHFVAPTVYMQMMPRRLPAHRELVYASGAAEIAGGAGLMHPCTRRWAGWWLIATLIAVFPANVNMALNPDRYAQHVRGGERTLIARLPLQLVLMAWVRAAARRA